jgi:hypothetical protein
LGCILVKDLCWMNESSAHMRKFPLSPPLSQLIVGAIGAKCSADNLIVFTVLFLFLFFPENSRKGEPNCPLGFARGSDRAGEYISRSGTVKKYTFLGLLAKIKCSICSYQFNI